MCLAGLYRAFNDPPRPSHCGFDEGLLTGRGCGTLGGGPPAGATNDQASVAARHLRPFRNEVPSAARHDRIDAVERLIEQAWPPSSDEMLPWLGQKNGEASRDANHLSDFIELEARNCP
jgi:hypothetical protein